MKRSLVTVTLFIAAISASAQTTTKQTENTVRRAENAPVPTATVADMAWLAGRWTGTGLGGWTEEIWSPPAAGTMMGVFRLVQKDKPVFYEFMTIRETDRGLAMQLKHFNPDMTAWEEKEKFVEFLYAGAEGKRVYFQGLTFDRVADDRVTIYLALRKKDGSVAEERFEMTRQP